MRRILFFLTCFGLSWLGTTFGAQESCFAFAPHLKFVSTYLQPGTELPPQNYLPEFLDHLTAAHLGPEYFGTIRGTLQNQQAIIDLGTELFDFDKGAILPNYATQLNTIGTKYLDGYTSKILAFYIADEPSSYSISRADLEAAIAATKKRFPGIPTFIVWNQDCFDNDASLDSKCGAAGKRGIPAGLDWIGFDWYFRGDPSLDQGKFKSIILPTVSRIKSLCDLPIVLVPDGTDEYLKDYPADQRDQTIANRFQMYFDLAQADGRVIGIDNYAWADHSEILYQQTVVTDVLGTREFPISKKVLFDFADSLTRF